MEIINKTGKKDKNYLIIKKYKQYLLLEKSFSPNTLAAYLTDLDSRPLYAVSRPFPYKNQIRRAG